MWISKWECERVDKTYHMWFSLYKHSQVSSLSLTHTHLLRRLRLNRTIFQSSAKCIDKGVHACTHTHTHIHRSVKLGQQWRVGFNAEHIRSLKLICIFMWVAIKMTHTHTHTVTSTHINKYMHVHIGLNLSIPHTCPHARIHANALTHTHTHTQTTKHKEKP